MDFDFLVGKTPVRLEDSAGPSHLVNDGEGGRVQSAGKGGNYMRRLIALTIAIALALPLIVGFRPRARTAPTTAPPPTWPSGWPPSRSSTSSSGPLSPRAPPSWSITRCPCTGRCPMYREVPVYRDPPVYRGAPVYRNGYGYRRVAPRPYGPAYQRVLPYPHGRYELRGDGHRDYGWVWIPNGRYPRPPSRLFPVPVPSVIAGR